MHASNVIVGIAYKWKGMIVVRVIGIYDPGFFAIEENGDGQVFKVYVEDLEEMEGE